MRIKGQSLVQYLLIGVVVVGLGFTLVPLFQETNKSLSDSSNLKSNSNLNQEGIITTAPVTTIIPTDNNPPALPPTPPGPPPPPAAVGECGPSGCGTKDLPTEEAICGPIPGPAGVLDDGCWICNAGSSFWEWETNLVNCANYWYGDLANTCSSKCLPYTPPISGTFGGCNKKCYICINDGSSEGLWAQWHEHDNDDCGNFWNAPYNCYGSSDAHYDPTCGGTPCSGVPPLAGWYVDKQTDKLTCWVCDDDKGKWINTNEDNNIDHCKKYWEAKNPTCVNYNHVDVKAKKDFPYCGCKTEPPARGEDPLGNGECWVCNSGSWIKETNAVECNDFWVNDNCPAGSVTEPLSCGDALPGGSPGAGNCWLCTNPTENYMAIAYNPADPLYALAGEPCDHFWVEEEYPGYIDIPGVGTTVDNVCIGSGVYAVVTSLDPGIVYDPVKGQWGCWACNAGNGKIWQWTGWSGDRFDNIASPQYQACEAFWIDGVYPAVIPPSLIVSEWAYEYGGSGYEYGRAMAENAGFLYVAGDESSDADGGNTDITVMKVDKSNGQVTWKKQSGGANEERGTSLAISDADKIYVAGYEVSDAAGGNYDIAITRLDTGGCVDWKKQYGGVGNEKAHSIAISDTNIYVTGYETSDTDGGNEDIFVMKIDAGGCVSWKKQYGGADRDVGHGITATEDFVYVTGYEMSDTDGASSDIFVMKLEPDGDVVWKKQYGGIGIDRGYAIKTLNGDIYVTGYEMSDSGGGKEDVFAMKLDNNGNVVWKNQYGGAETDKGYSIEVSDGSLYITGEENSDADLGQKDLFVMKLNKDDGSVIWKQEHGGAKNEEGHAVVISSGILYLTGTERSDTDGGYQDSLVMSINSHQTTSNLDGWTIEGPITAWNVIGHEIDEWTVSADVITNGAGGWTEDGTNLAWAESGDSLTDGAGNWNLEGNILDTEDIDWHIAVIPPPPPPPVIEWAYQFGGGNDDAGRAIATPGDGYIYVAGEESSDGDGGNKDVFVMKLEEAVLDGAPGAGVVWKREFGRAGDDAANSIVMSGGNIYVTGYKSSACNNENIFVMKLNNAGNLQWMKEYGGCGRDIGIGITIGGGDLYVVAEEDSAAGGGGDGDIAVMKLNETNGNIIWAMQYGGAQDEFEDGGFSNYHWGRNIVYNGGFLYIAADETSDDSPPSGARDAVVMKLDAANGNVSWVKQYGGDEEDKAYSIAVSALGDIYICGEESSDNTSPISNDDIYVLKIASDGTTIWRKKYGGSPSKEKAFSIILSGGFLYVSGEERSDPDGGSRDIFVMQIDEFNGDVLWKNQYGGVADEKGFSSTISGTNLYIVGSENSDPQGGGKDIVVMKLDINQGASNIDDWSIDQSISVVAEGNILDNLRWTMDGNVINAWPIGDSNNAPDDINLPAKWPIRAVNICDWTVQGNWTPATGNSLNWNLGGIVLNDEVINDWTIGF